LKAVAASFNNNTTAPAGIAVMGSLPPTLNDDYPAQLLAALPVNADTKIVIDSTAGLKQLLQRETTAATALKVNQSELRSVAEAVGWSSTQQHSDNSNSDGIKEVTLSYWLYLHLQYHL
jgi:fructose-1-phosphate kinase PfkB-like protein